MNQRLKPVLLTVLLGGLSILALDAQSPGESNPHSGEHGDNPVVGSLPVEVSPDLDMMFIDAGRANFPYNDAMLGFIGDADLDGDILTAGGVPTGQINRGSNFDVFGISHSGYVVFPREDGRLESITSKLWLPDEFLGGHIVMNSNVGSLDTVIDESLTRMPLRMLCNSISPVVDAWIIATPDRDSTAAPISVHVVIVGEIVTVTYLP
ncbi:MAG: hypothetical protein ACPG31_08370 [Planctomycetota bacterium]